MSRPLCWSSLLCSYWSFIVHILGDAEEIGWASHQMYPWHLKRVYCKNGHASENGQLQSDDNCKWQWKVEDTYVGNIIYLLFLHIFFISCLNVLFHSLITIGLITLKHFWCWFLYTVFVSISTSYTLMVVLIHICIFHNIYLLHIYYIIITYL